MPLNFRALPRVKPLALIASALVGALGITPSVQAKSLVCVWDVAGKTGDVYAQAVYYALAMQKQQKVDIEIKSYVDERVAEIGRAHV